MDLSPQQRRSGISGSLAAGLMVSGAFASANAATPLYVHWQEAWGFSSGTLTVVFAAYMVGLIGTLLFAGRMADRYGRRVVLVPGMIIALLSSMCFFFASSAAWLFLGRFGAGIAGGAIVTAGMATVVDLAPPHRKKLGSLLSSVSMVLGVGSGALIAGGAAAFMDVPQVLVFGVMIALTAIGLVISLVLPLHKPVSAVVTRERFRIPRAPHGHGRDILWGIATFGPGITATSFILSLAPSVLVDVLDEPNSLIAGIIVCITFFAAFTVQFALARLRTRTHLLLSSILAVLAMVALIINVTVLPSVILFTAMAILAGCAQGVGQLAGFTLIGTRIPAERRAESNAVLNISVYIPAALLPIGAGFLADVVGLAPAIAVFAIVVGTAAAICAPLVRRSVHKQERKAVLSRA